MRAGAGRDIVAPSAYPRGMAYDALDAALIDLDGTLVDTLGDFELVLHMAMGELGLPTVDRAFIARTVGKGSTHLLQRCLAHVGADPGLLDALWALYQRHYLEVNGRQSHVYPGIPEGLVKMREAGLKLACVTNKPLAFAVPLLEGKGLAPHFEHVFGGESFERGKPDPMPFVEACKRLGSAPGRTLVVGDSSNDAQAARAAGCPLALARYGYNHGEGVDGLGADAVFDRLDELAWPPG